MLLFTLFNECKTIASKSLSTAFEKKHHSFQPSKNISWCVRLFKINNTTKKLWIQTTCMCTVKCNRHVKSWWENCYKSKFFGREMVFLIYSGYFSKRKNLIKHTLYFQMNTCKPYFSCNEKSKVSLTNRYWKSSLFNLVQLVKGWSFSTLVRLWAKK